MFFIKGSAIHQYFDILKSFCYFWALDMAPIWAGPDLLCYIEPCVPFETRESLLKTFSTEMTQNLISLIMTQKFSQKVVWTRVSLLKAQGENAQMFSKKINPHNIFLQPTIQTQNCSLSFICNVGRFQILMRFPYYVN